MYLYIALIMMVIAAYIPLAYALAPQQKIYTFSNCATQTTRNEVVYYCYGDPTHPRTIFYMAIINR